jgi:polysaccharide biosynthesis protein PslH
LHQLLDAVFPAVKALVPEARLVIVGRSPASLRRRARRQPGTELRADVADLRPLLAASAVMAAPLLSGDGSRPSVLASLAAGVPVVATRAGAGGLLIRPGLDYTLADTPEGFTRALVRCLQQPEAARRQAEQGRETVAGRYDWSSLAGRLGRVWEKARSAG